MCPQILRIHEATDLFEDHMATATIAKVVEAPSEKGGACKKSIARVPRLERKESVVYA